MQSLASNMSLDRQHDFAADDDDDEAASAHNTSDEMTWSSRINQMTAEFESFTSQGELILGASGGEAGEQSSACGGDVTSSRGEMKNAFEDLEDDEEDLGMSSFNFQWAAFASSQFSQIIFVFRI